MNRLEVLESQCSELLIKQNEPKLDDGPSRWCDLEVRSPNGRFEMVVASIRLNRTDMEELINMLTKVKNGLAKPGFEVQ